MISPALSSNAAPAVVRNWKRFLVLGCSHSHHVHRPSWDALLKFKADFKPHFTAHLGDWADTSGMRSGADDSSDDAEEIGVDIDTGLMHLTTLEPQLVLEGNHDERPKRYLHHRKAMVRHCAKQVIEQINSHIVGALKAAYVPYDGMFQGRILGNGLLTHGTIYNVNAARDMAEAYGNDTTKFVLFAHTHAAVIQSARAHHGCTGYNIGCLTDRRAMEYAKNRRQTLAWSTGWAYGEYCDNEMRPQLHIERRESTHFPKVG